MQFGFHVEQLLGFGLRELHDRNARGGGDDFGDHVLVHDHLHVGAAFMPGGFLIFELVLQAFEIVAHGGGLFEVLILDGLFLFGADLGDLGFELFEFGRRGESLDAQARTGFIDQVDGLVGQATVLNVPG